VKAETVIYFTEKEEEFANLLTEIGITRKMAKVLVFLVNMPDATTHMIEAGTDMRQPEVSFAMGLLKKRGWITSSEYKNEYKTRPAKIYKLAKPITEILDSIKEEVEIKANNELESIKKLQNYLKN